MAVPPTPEGPGRISPGAFAFSRAVIPHTAGARKSGGGEAADQHGGTETTQVTTEHANAITLSSPDMRGFRPAPTRGKIDLVLLDMIMPGKDGRAVYEALRMIEPDVKVILSSGYTLDGPISEEMIGGIARYVQKPYSITELCAVIGEVLTGP